MGRLKLVVDFGLELLVGAVEELNGWVDCMEVLVVGEEVVP